MVLSADLAIDEETQTRNGQDKTELPGVVDDEQSRLRAVTEDALGKETITPIMASGGEDTRQEEHAVNTTLLATTASSAVANEQLSKTENEHKDLTDSKGPADGGLCQGNATAVGPAAQSQSADERSTLNIMQSAQPVCTESKATAGHGEAKQSGQTACGKGLLLGRLSLHQLLEQFEEMMKQDKTPPAGLVASSDGGDASEMSQTGLEEGEVDSEEGETSSEADMSQPDDDDSVILPKAALRSDPSVVRAHKDLWYNVKGQVMCCYFYVYRLNSVRGILSPSKICLCVSSFQRIILVFESSCDIELSSLLSATKLEMDLGIVSCSLSTFNQHNKHRS